MSDIVPQDTPQKQCSKCKKFFPATTEYFHAQKSKKYGLRSHCRICRAEYNAEHKDKTKAWHQEHKEEEKAYREKYKETDTYKESVRRASEKHREKRNRYRKEYYRANIEKYRAYGREYAKTHKEEVRKRQEINKEQRKRSRRKWYEKNKHLMTESARIKRKQNPEQHRAWIENRRARKKAAKGSYSHADVKRQYDNQKGKCYYCHKEVGKKYDVDHIVPITRGGSNDPSNLVIACQSCNRSKNNKLPHEWPEGGRLL